ncbi:MULTISPECIES: HNH endonuclease [Arthrobacter]|uniref:HNH endonuclease n=1 Tax=Arthrobacter terricola TaxID=2547396 RepID=A0A4R5K5G4_9MICC|nr:HNH endonuclease [Arthrobacter sp. GN70]TDF88135.1 HNH endonuclease [Arthrobacter terricola]
MRCSFSIPQRPDLPPHRNTPQEVVIATSRTGTATWKRIRKRALKEAQERGITRCPYCKVTLNYEVSRLPSSAEPDHIIPHEKGGPDALHNLRIICRACNISKSNRAAPKAQTVLRATPLKTSRRW